MKSTADEGLRPAMARTREALFSILEADGISWSGYKVLDLFAGCGSLAFECLSRGADLAFMVDNSPAAIDCLKKNAVNLDMENQCRIFKEDVLRFLRNPKFTFDLIFIDPPYHRNLTSPSLTLINKNNWIKDNGYIVAEIEKDADFTVPEAFIPFTTRSFGQTNLHIWKKQ